ncbi:YncE family protein [Salegentibacter sp. HM20]
MKFNLLFRAFIASVILGACATNDDPIEIPEPVEGTFSEGIFVLNEGNFGAGNSSVSFLDADFTEIQHQIFSEENNRALGDTGQDIGFYEDYAFIVMNVSARIEVVDRHSFESLGSISTGLENPRFIDFFDGKAYVSNWGDGMDPNDDYIAIFDVESLQPVATIEVAEGPEKLLRVNNRIYVAHTGGFSFNNKLSVINPQTNELQQELEVGDVPNSMVSNGVSLWVLSSGLPSYAGEETPGKITQIDLVDHSIVNELDFEGTQHPSNLNLDDQYLYYTMNDEVFTIDLSEQNLPGTGIYSFDNEGVLYGFSVKNQSIFATFATYDFTGNGKLKVIDIASGNATDFSTGINPNGIFFQE